jgi:hypothetical protein
MPDMKVTREQLEAYVRGREIMLQEIFREADIFVRSAALRNEDFRIAAGIIAVFERFAARALKTY